MNIYKRILYLFRNRGAYVQRYLWPLPRFKREMVVMVDGNLPHGGLTDRLRNILSIYQFSKENNIPFYIYYCYPCDLSLILLPNEYNWRISKSRLSYHVLDYKEIYLFVSEKPRTGEWKHSSANTYNNQIHISVLKDCTQTRRKIQYHEYGNAYFAKGNYKTLFNELFKPSNYLMNRLISIMGTIPKVYESVTLRFQQLLGDFVESGFEVLSQEEREGLISTCVSKISDLYESLYFSTGKILVTSDSQTFLDRVSKLDFVCIIPGKMEHMDYTHNSDLEMNTKSFVDLYMLMGATKLTLLKTGKMYESGFAEFAAELGDKPYEIISF